jgi:hypothetical protein
MAIKDTIGPGNYERLRVTLAKAFPDTTEVTDTLVDATVESMWRNYDPAYAELGVPPPQGPVDFSVSGPIDLSTSPFPVYVGHATHKRTLKMGSKAPMDSEFVGHLPMVRVTLPPELTGTSEDVISTPLGEVYLSGDHLVGSIALIADKYADAQHLGYTPGRVDLVTPARSTGTRFGAIAVYIGYRAKRDLAPSFYILEAGTATGEAKMLYFGKTIDTTILQTSWYVPTAYSAATNSYRGQFRVHGSDPVHLLVQAFEPGHDKPYMQVDVLYEKVNSIDPPWPADLTLQAAQRVALIGQTMKVPSGVPLEGLMANRAGSLPWTHKPKLG